MCLCWQFKKKNNQYILFIPQRISQKDWLVISLGKVRYGNIIQILDSQATLHQTLIISTSSLLLSKEKRLPMSESLNTKRKQPSLDEICFNLSKIYCVLAVKPHSSFQAKFSFRVIKRENKFISTFKLTKLQILSFLEPDQCWTKVLGCYNLILASFFINFHLKWSVFSTAEETHQEPKIVSVCSRVWLNERLLPKYTIFI